MKCVQCFVISHADPFRENLSPKDVFLTVPVSALPTPCRAPTHQTNSWVPGGFRLELRRTKISGPTNFAHVAHVGPREAPAMIREGTAERKSRVISGPTNFSHIAHIGPGAGTQTLIDLPVVSSILIHIYKESLLSTKQNRPDIQIFQVQSSSRILLQVCF